MVFAAVLAVVDTLGSGISFTPHPLTLAGGTPQRWTTLVGCATSLKLLLSRDKQIINTEVNNEQSTNR